MPRGAKLTGCVPMLWVPDLTDAVEYYVETLGFKCDALEPDGHWAQVTRDGISIMFALPYEGWDFEEPEFTGSIYFRTDKVDSMWKKISKNEDVNVCYPPDDMDYGMREFGIYDLNGYLLQFGQPLSEVED